MDFKVIFPAFVKSLFPYPTIDSSFDLCLAEFHFSMYVICYQGFHRVRRENILTPLSFLMPSCKNLFSSFLCVYYCEIKPDKDCIHSDKLPVERKSR